MQLVIQLILDYNLAKSLVLTSTPHMNARVFIYIRK